MKQAILEFETRTDMGTRCSRALRAAGRVPVVVYGHGEPPEMISVDRHDLEVEMFHGQRNLALNRDGTIVRYLIKDVQYDHLGICPLHVDLMRVDLDERVQLSVALELRGVPKGVTDGGVLEQTLSELEVDCLALAIPETLHPLVTELGIGDVLYARDVVLPEGVTLISDQDERIATVRMLAEEVDEEAEAEGESTAEPELIGRDREEESSDS